MNKDSTLPNALRRAWMDHTGDDPLRSSQISRRLLWLFLGSLVMLAVAFFWFVFVPTSFPNSSNSDYGYLAILGVIGVIVSIALDTRNDKNVMKFARAVASLCQDTPYEYEISALVQLSFFGDLRPIADQKLRALAQRIKDLQAQAQETEANKIRLEEFKPLHQSFYQLGLADETWDSYFR
ncbi:MAG: hypothetical protein V1704_00410 [Candidatus Vogelbacteria bacterium]